MAFLTNIRQQALPEPEVHYRGIGSCPLVLGECVQGRVRGGPHFLITAPIRLCSEAEFIADPAAGCLSVEPAHCVKSLMAVHEYLSSQSLPLSGTLRVFTGAQVSLGFGTSTADITASIRATAGAWGRRVSPETISRIASYIEPTDGSMYSGSVAYAHREGRLLERFGSLPPFRALVMLSGDGVDTVVFDARRVHFRYSATAEEKLRMAWRMVRTAVRTRDLRLMAEAGTISAEINQELLPKPLFNEVRDTVRHLGAEGLLVAHSGSLLAIILDPGTADYPERRDRIARFVEEELEVPSWFELSSYEPPSRPRTALHGQPAAGREPLNGSAAFAKGGMA
jgi:L-threonine kinase